MQKILDGIKLDYDDVVIVPKRSDLYSRSEVNLVRQFYFAHSPRTLKCSPIVVANMDTTGTFSMAKSLCPQDAIVCLHKHYKVEDLEEFYLSNQDISDKVFCSLGTSNNDVEKLQRLMFVLKMKGAYLPNLCIDVANGYSETFAAVLAQLRNMYPESIIMAGNVVTPNMVEELLLHSGVDIVKIGIGPGSVCTTRLKTGVGYGQLSACLECADAAHGLKGHICADGGCKYPGDVAKALGANSDFAMLGNMFAGTDECEGDWIYEYKCGVKKYDGTWISEWYQPFDPGGAEKRKKSFRFYGMSSKEAMEKHHGGVADYRTSEGRCVTIPYKGLANEVLSDIYGGLRSACTYIGAKNIKDFGKKTTFALVNNTHNRIYEKN